MPAVGVRSLGRVLQHPPPGALPLVHAVAFDVVFVLGVLDGPGGPGQAWSPWLGLPGHLLTITLPLLLLVTVVVALTGRPTAEWPSWTALGRWQAATVAVAGLGLAVYLSPWGRAGITAVLET